MEKGEENVAITAADRPSADSTHDAALNFQDGDPANPINWSNKYKWTIVLLVSLLQMVV